MTKQSHSPPLFTGNLPISATLVFPATHPDGRIYIDAALERQEFVIAATSEHGSELSDDIPGMINLPYVYESNFSNVLLSHISKSNITKIYAPVVAVHSWLSRFIVENKLSIQLIGESPIKREMVKFGRLMQKVDSYRSFIDECSDGLNSLSNIEIASVFRMSGNIYGESNDQKIAAMMSIFSDTPKGDVIEIGALVGKSASVLALMARRYKVGNVLVIDPWQQIAGTQNDSPDNVKVHMIGEWDYEMLPKDFALNILPIGLGYLNFLQMESENGFHTYQKNPVVSTDIFGITNYTGNIAVIHIDGNHDFEKVNLDCKLWLPLLDTHGWLILDDYIWAHGDGPFRVGNTLLANRSAEIERSFVCGKALFIKFGAIGGS